MARKPLLVLAALTAAALTAVPSGANADVALSGSASYLSQKQDLVGAPHCADPTFAGECAPLQLAGYGPATYTFEYGPTFEPDPENPGCFIEDGTFTLTLASDGSTLTGDLAGTICYPGQSAQRSAHSYGNPFSERDTVTFTDGTGQFEGLTGTATFTQFSAGARYRVTLNGTLS